MVQIERGLRSRPIPLWVIHVIERIDKRHPFPQRVITVTWRKGSSRYRTKGLANVYTGRISVTCSNMTFRRHAINDHKLVLVHELAHLLAPQPKHDAAFWAICFTLFMEERMDMDYCAQASLAYKKGAAAGIRAVQNHLPKKP